MDKEGRSPVDGDAKEPAFYTMNAARDFGAKIARQYKAISPRLLVEAFIEGLLVNGDVVSINQLLGDVEVKQWLADMKASDRLLRSALNAARQKRRQHSAADSGLLVPPKRRNSPSGRSTNDS